MMRVVVWDPKGEEGNSHGDGNQMFGRQRVRSVSPALAGGFFTTEPPREAWLQEQNCLNSSGSDGKDQSVFPSVFSPFLFST